MIVRRLALHRWVFGALSAAGALLAPAVARAQDYAGNYRVSSDVTSAEVPEWGPDCGSRPESHRGSTGRQVRVSMDGPQLVVEDRPRMRSDGCWSQNPRTRRVSTSGGNGRWTTQCTSPAEDYQHEDGTYTTSVEGNRLTLRDRTVYRWTLQNSSCRATITRTIVYERVDAPAPTQDSGVAVTPPTAQDSGLRVARCALPGPAARMAIIAGRRSTTPGSRVCFRAQLQDAAGCPAIDGSSAVITWSVARRGGGAAPAGEGGCVTVAPSEPPGTEFSITASAATGLEERVLLRVVSAEESQSLVAQSIEEEDAGALDDASTPRIREDFGSIAVGTPIDASSSSKRNIVVAALTAAAVLLAGVAVFLLRKKKPEPSRRPSEPPRVMKVEPAPSEGNRASTPPGGPRVRKDEVPIPMQQMPIGGLPPLGAGASQPRPTNLNETMIGAMPAGTSGVLAGAGVVGAGPRAPSKATEPSTAAASVASPPLTKRCPACNQRFSAENAFCPDHGVALVESDAAVTEPRVDHAAPSRAQSEGARTRVVGTAETPTRTLRCPVCNKTFAPGNVFCGEDGVRLEDA